MDKESKKQDMQVIIFISAGLLNNVGPGSRGVLSSLRSPRMIAIILSVKLPRLSGIKMKKVYTAGEK